MVKKSGGNSKITRLAELTLQRPSSGVSTKTLRADLARLRRHLGKPCPHFGKKGVVQLATPAKSENPPRFNKYAGYVEWQNAVFLWVNAAGGKFTNTFRRGGREVDWYVGGANPTEASPIVRRLLGQGQTKTPLVCLFMRGQPTEPYVYCGACNYVAHNQCKKGFEFTWSLRDFDAVAKKPEFSSLMRPVASTSTVRTSSRWL